MKIYLYLENKILDFSIPKKVSGSFSFDENPEEESKLINIEARDNEWIIYSTTDVGVIIGRTPTNSTSLQVNNYYILRRNNTNYLIYVADSFDNSFQSFSYNDKLNLAIGNDQTCNIYFFCELLKGLSAIINIKNGNLTRCAS